MECNILTFDIGCKDLEHKNIVDLARFFLHREENFKKSKDQFVLL